MALSTFLSKKNDGHFYDITSFVYQFYELHNYNMLHKSEGVGC